MARPQSIHMFFFLKKKRELLHYLTIDYANWVGEIFLYEVFYIEQKKMGMHNMKWTNTIRLWITHTLLTSHALVWSFFLPRFNTKKKYWTTKIWKYKKISYIITKIWKYKKSLIYSSTSIVSSRVLPQMNTKNLSTKK